MAENFFFKTGDKVIAPSSFLPGILENQSFLWFSYWVFKEYVIIFFHHYFSYYFYPFSNIYCVFANMVITKISQGPYVPLEKVGNTPVILSHGCSLESAYKLFKNTVNQGHLGDSLS